jgi:tRNA wybutosine-synthesizing protein 1
MLPVLPNQLSETAKADLTKQKYRVVGSHTAVKVCGWTKKMIKGQGGCYKLKFYGIMSHQCMQMSPSISCANRCTFCWRGYKAPVSKDWKWNVDEPEMIAEQSQKEHHQLLIGLKGYDGAAKAVYNQSTTVKHVALSLTGEPITYPKINGLIKSYDKQGISTFLVTNATYPEQIKNLSPITQLYISLDAPTKTQLKEIDKPLFPDFWERLNKSLDYLAQKPHRTCIRITVIKGLNDNHLEQYAKLIHKGDPDFLEVKAYMFIGASRDRLKQENMPLHQEVVQFSKDLLKHLPGYEIVSEHIPSRVTMFAKKKYKIDGKWMTWIDFSKWTDLVLSGKEFTSMDYLKTTPQTGISGKGTVWLPPKSSKKKASSGTSLPQINQDIKITIDEKTDELEFWSEDEKSDKSI